MKTEKRKGLCHLASDGLLACNAFALSFALLGPFAKKKKKRYQGSARALGYECVCLSISSKMSHEQGLSDEQAIYVATVDKLKR